MRLCRFRLKDAPPGAVQIGLFGEERIVPLATGAAAYTAAYHEKLRILASDDLFNFLPPDGRALAEVKKLAVWVARGGGQQLQDVLLPTAAVELLAPFPRPNKLFLLAGNYAKHVQEVGRTAAERDETFPYVFMKPSTTLTDPGKPFALPKNSPDFIDWELELAVVIGRKAKHVREADALSHVAGYTIVNDVSNRRFRPNPGRRERDQDKFFDWLHGKWFDGFCPCGPCLLTADAVADPQAFSLELKLNGETRQKATTGSMIFPVAAIVAFVSSICTLEPGDVISTGTPEGVGHATGTYLKPGDLLEAGIEGIGVLTTPVIAES
ncbi:MAG: fumarylacetoacetate hydrolase family protein [Planctomycetia bacterium]